jgi:hypothetical protein
MFLRKIISVVTVAAASLLSVAAANAKVFYVAQNASRSNAGGTGCSDALSAAWFSNSASWGTASHQISAGTTVYLCGVFHGSAGQELLTVRGSGSAGSPITIKFLTGTVLSAPHWSGNGAIHMDGVSDIVVDGGTNGVIENTANGTGRAYHQNSVAVHAAGCNGCTVQNLTIQNLYVRTSASDTAPSHSINCVYWHGSNSLTINRVTCHDASWAIAGDGNNFTLANSDIYHVDHGVASGAVGAASNYTIHNNHFHDFANWDSPNNTYHHDAIHIWGQNGGKVSGGAIYNNTFDGDFGVNVTAHVYLQDSISHFAVYNNVFSTPSNRVIHALWFAAGSTTSLPGGSATGNSAYNNSINAGGHHSGTALFVESQLLFTAVNNILAGGQSNITIQGGGTRSSTGINNNVYRDLFAEFGDTNTFGFSGGNYYTLAKWQAVCHCDFASKLITGAQTTAFSSVTGPAGSTTVAAASVTSPDAVAASDSVNLAVVATPTTKDPELELLASVGQGNGLNLIDIAVDALAPLALDLSGASRPASGPWNVGPF